MFIIKNKIKIVFSIFTLVVIIGLAANGKAVYLTVPPTTLNFNTVNNLKMVNMSTKYCLRCDTSKSIFEFYKDKTRADGLFPYCKECIMSLSSNYRKTKDGLITQIYSGQKSISKRRGNPPPLYSKQELKEWLFSQSLFHTLHSNWAASGYSVKLTPSCDRTDDYRGYSLDRLQLTTWNNNFHKSNRDRVNGINNKHSKAVIGTHKVNKVIVEFYSQNEAHRRIGIAAQSISACCLGKRASAGSYTWKFKQII